MPCSTPSQHPSCSLFCRCTPDDGACWEATVWWPGQSCNSGSWHKERLLQKIFVWTFSSRIKVNFTLINSNSFISLQADVFKRSQVEHYSFTWLWSQMIWVEMVGLPFLDLYCASFKFSGTWCFCLWDLMLLSVKWR